MGDRLDSFSGNDYYDNDYPDKQDQQQNTQNNLKNKFNLRIDLNKINNDISFSQNSE